MKIIIKNYKMARKLKKYGFYKPTLKIFFDLMKQKEQY